MLQPDGNPIAKLIGVDDMFKESELLVSAGENET
jgi:hypothetical protein